MAGGSWISISKCVRRFGWQDVNDDVIRQLTDADMKSMLLSVAWRNAMDEWIKDMHKKPKLSMINLIVGCEVQSSCAFLKVKSERRMMLKLRGGTAAFQIEMGRWYGVRKEDRICKKCGSGEIEDVCHKLLQCSA